MSNNEQINRFTSGNNSTSEVSPSVLTGETSLSNEQESNGAYGEFSQSAKEYKAGFVAEIRARITGAHAVGDRETVAAQTETLNTIESASADKLYARKVYGDFEGMLGAVQRADAPHKAAMAKAELDEFMKEHESVLLHDDGSKEYFHELHVRLAHSMPRLNNLLERKNAMNPAYKFDTQAVENVISVYNTNQQERNAKY